MTNVPIILALDISSTHLGYVVWRGQLLGYGDMTLQGADIALKCQCAADAMGLVMNRHRDLDCLALESPVARYAKAVIPQARVSGAVLALAASRWLPVVEITPSAAKKALCGRGDASKVDMQVAALPYGVRGEHASDALGVALAAVPLVRVVEQEAS